MSQAHLYCRFVLWWASKKTVKSKIRLVFLWLHFSVISFFHRFTVCNWEQSSALLSHGCSPFPFRLLGIHLYSVSARLCSWSLWGLFTVKYSSDTMLKCRNYSSLRSFLLLDAVTLCRPLSVARKTGKDVWWATVCTCFCQHLAHWNRSSSQNQIVLWEPLPLELVFFLVCLMRNTELGRKKKVTFMIPLRLSNCIIQCPE